MITRSAASIDKNFDIPTVINKDGLSFYDACELSLYGVEHIDGKFRRMKEQDAAAVGENILLISSETAGGRVKFATDSNKIAVYAEYASVAKVPNYSLSATMGFDIYSGEKFVGVFVPSFDAKSSYESVIDLPAADGSMQEYTINFPICSEVTKLLVGVTSTSKIAPGKEYKNEKPIVFYGSSTTQGACASHPGNSYPSILSRVLDSTILNLAFWGNAKGEEAMAEYIAKLDMSAFVFDYDYHSPSAEHLRATHEPMFKIIRDKQPDLPIIILSAPIPYPTENDIERIEIIKKTYENAVNRGDKHVYFFSGSEMLASVRGLALADNVHPGDVGFAAISTALTPVLENILK